MLQQVLVRMMQNWETQWSREESELLPSLQEADYLLTELGS